MVPELGAFNSTPQASDHLDHLLAPDTTLPWYRTIFANVAETLHPEKLPPLEITSKPLAEDEMPGHGLWGLYRANRNSGVMSVLIHVGLFCLLWSITTSPPAVQLARQITMLVSPPPPVHPVEIMQPQRGGGGGGNNALKAPAVATLPKPIMRHYTPPPPADRPPPAVAPQLYIPPEWVGTTDPNAHYGDPLASLIGAAGGFGNSGNAAGFGTGSGPGFGPGSGGGSGGGTGGGIGPGTGKGDQIYTSAKAMMPPEPIFRPEAEYTDEARKAQLNGKVILTLVVETDGTATNIEVTRGLGLGLEQKAIEAVRQWKFKPATIAGEPVRARVNVEVAFRLMVS
jgi:TonB family protein